MSDEKAKEILKKEKKKVNMMIILTLGGMRKASKAGKLSIWKILKIGLTPLLKAT